MMDRYGFTSHEMKKFISSLSLSFVPEVFVSAASTNLLFLVEAVCVASAIPVDDVNKRAVSNSDFIDFPSDFYYRAEPGQYSTDSQRSQTGAIG